MAPTSLALSKVRQGIKRTARHAVDRAARPYVEEVIRRVTPPPVEPTDAPGAEAAPTALILHNALHSARTIALATMPEVTGTVLSVGPNGRWYFDWFDSAYGHISRHIAVEAYTEKPEVLPGNVEWVVADIAAPEGIPSVGDGKVGLVFSGQNIEHLWPHQVVSFLVESNRVLEPGGWLVVDSPNRNLTRSYRWSMAEHTVEFTPEEARSLLEIAGFEVRSMRGLWLCRSNGHLLPLDPPPDPVETLDRLALGARHPDDSFIWWAEAVKVGEPDEPKLRDAVVAIYKEHWKERLSRLQARDGASLDPLSDSIHMAKGTAGYALIGPYMPLPPGTYTFRLPVSWGSYGGEPGPIATLEVVLNETVGASVPISVTESSGSMVATVEVTTEALSFATHVRLLCSGHARIAASVGLELDPDPWRMTSGLDS